MVRNWTAGMVTKIAGIVIAVLAIAIGWQAFEIAKYKLAVSESGKAMAELNTQLGVCQANNSALNRSITNQNTAIELAAFESARKRAAVLAARDQAVADLAAMKGDYANLRKSWPQECIAAVGAVRRELGL